MTIYVLKNHVKTRGGGGGGEGRVRLLNKQNLHANEIYDNIFVVSNKKNTDKQIFSKYSRSRSLSFNSS